jgi:hypothetical protein
MRSTLRPGAAASMTVEVAEEIDDPEGGRAVCSSVVTLDRTELT